MYRITTTIIIILSVFSLFVLIFFPQTIFDNYELIIPLIGGGLITLIIYFFNVEHTANSLRKTLAETLLIEIIHNQKGYLKFMKHHDMISFNKIYFYKIYFGLLNSTYIRYFDIELQNKLYLLYNYHQRDHYPPNKSVEIRLLFEKIIFMLNDIMENSTWLKITKIFLKIKKFIKNKIIRKSI